LEDQNTISDLKKNIPLNLFQGLNLFNQRNEKKQENVILNDGARYPLAGSKNSIQPADRLGLQGRQGINSTHQSLNRY